MTVAGKFSNADAISSHVAYCLSIGITSSKTKCVRLRNGRSLQHPKQTLPGRSSMPLEGQFLCCAVTLSILAIALYKNFPQNVLVSSSFWSPRTRRHGPCMYVYADDTYLCLWHNNLDHLQHMVKYGVGYGPVHHYVRNPSEQSQPPFLASWRFSSNSYFGHNNLHPPLICCICVSAKVVEPAH